MKLKEKLSLTDALKVAGAVALGSLTGCAGTAPTYRDCGEPIYKRDSVYSDVKNWYIYPVMNGYTTSESNITDLRIIAGIFAGTIDVAVVKNNNEYNILIDGYYSPFDNPESMKKVLRLADRDKNKVVTREEVTDFKRKLYKYLSQKK